MSAFQGVARAVAGIGIGAVAAVHTAWAAGSTWPAGSRAELAEAVVGNRNAMPDRRATAVVAGVAAIAAVTAAGAFGESRAVVRGRRLIGAALLGRAALGGDVALAALGLPAAGERFRELDCRWYRPLCATLGTAALFGARASRRGDRNAEPRATAS